MPAVDQKRGLKDLVQYIRNTEQVVGGRAALVAHNGLSFDLPVLVKSMERHDLMNEIAEGKLFFVDSLNVI